MGTRGKDRLVSRGRRDDALGESVRLHLREEGAALAAVDSSLNGEAGDALRAGSRARVAAIFSVIQMVLQLEFDADHLCVLSAEVVRWRMMIIKWKKAAQNFFGFLPPPHRAMKRLPWINPLIIVTGRAQSCPQLTFILSLCTLRGVSDMVRMILFLFGRVSIECCDARKQLEFAQLALLGLDLPAHFKVISVAQLGVAIGGVLLRWRRCVR